MERQELLNQLNELLESYGGHKAFADKAREQASSFSSSVIEKVIADHQIKASLVADDITPLLPLLSAEIAEIESAKANTENSKGDLGVRIEELELRKLIGEISDDEFDALSSEGRGTVEAANQELENLDAQLAELQAAMDKWVELSGASVEVAPAEVAPAEDAPAEIDPIEDEPAEVAAAEAFEASDDSDPIVDSILPGFEDADVGDESVEVESDSDDNEDVAFAIDEEEIEASVDVVPADEGAPAAVQVQIDDSAVDEIGVDASEEAGGDVEDDASRRAILLSNEGTPDEQIYALTGDVFTIGRGRDNDLQIKNDSKVSRFHCKLYRRAANFYLEDNKSSNGTMVNGELISERRLFGGEELVIGETFFRFRVM